MLPESEGAARIGGYESAASTAGLPNSFEDAQRDPALRAVLVRMLREMIGEVNWAESPTAPQQSPVSAYAQAARK